jgi:hypothetical protein
MTDSNRNGPRGSIPEQPRSEPEIIPPGRGRSSRDESGIFVAIDDGSGGRVYVARPGPFSIILALLIVGLIAAVILVALLGFVLIWIPVVIVLVAAAFLSASIRHYWRRFFG